MMLNKDQLGKLYCVDSGVKVWVNGQILYGVHKGAKLCNSSASAVNDILPDYFCFPQLYKCCFKTSVLTEEGVLAC